VYVATKHAINGFVRSLWKLSDVGIRVAAVAPGIIKTPLWTETPDKMRIIDPSQGEWVTPEEVATVMLALIEQDEVSLSILTPGEEGAKIPVGGGTVLEVSKSVRQVLPFNDPGPLGRRGNTMGRGTDVDAELLKLVQSGDWGKILGN
jgi:hypothetical protein